MLPQKQWSGESREAVRPATARMLPQNYSPREPFYGQWPDEPFGNSPDHWPADPKIINLPMRRPPLPVLLLLPLLAILLFGNCGGGVNGYLGYGPSKQNARLVNIINRREADRETARRTLHGHARRDAYHLIEQTTEARLDSFYPYHERGKMDTRRRKTERQLRRWYPRQPRASSPIEVPRVPAP